MFGVAGAWWFGVVMVRFERVTGEEHNGAHGLVEFTVVDADWRNKTH